MSDLRSLEADLQRVLGRIGPRTSFAEVLAQADRGEGVQVNQKQISLSRRPKLRGAVIRAWSGERWVEGATSALDSRSLDRAAEDVERALAKGEARVDPPGAPSTLRGEWETLPNHPMHDVDSNELIVRATEALGWARAVPGIKDCRVRLEWADEERLYLNSAGARCYQILPRVLVAFAPVAIENGRVEYDYGVLGALGGRDQLEFLSSERVTDLSRIVVEMLHSKPPPTGEMRVLLDPSTTGTFAHESFGHGTEADQFVRDRSYLRPILGQMLGPETLTIADEGSYPDGFGSAHFDDEGRATQKTLLVDRGKFVGALHDRDSASALHASPTGNARRSDFLSRIFVRMTNTYVEAGDWTFEELVEEARNGVLLEIASSGIEDPLGGQMQIKVNRGRLIENGQLGSRVNSMALSGKVLEFLRRIEGISEPIDFEMGPGTCGKGNSDMLPVSSGGTYLLSTAVVGPA